MSPRIGSLFSGYGGLDMAVQAVYGGEVVWYSEIDKHACTVLEALHPAVPNLGDITAVDWAAVPPIDILTGGYPCQPFSHAGQRKGTNDERHLWPFVRDAIVALRPVVTVLENVDGHRSLGLSDVLGDLADLGLSARWGVVRAADAGAPHGRKRVFIVVTDPDQRGRNEDVQQSRDLGAQAREGQSGIPHGHRADGLAAHACSKGPQGASALCDQATRSSRTAIVGSIAQPCALADPDNSRQQDWGITGSSELGSAESHTDAAADARGEGSQGRSVSSTTVHGAGSRRVGASGRSESAADARGGSLSGTATTANGLSVTAERGGVDWGKYAPAIRRWESVTRPAPDPTIPGANGRPRLSPAFVEWMMGLPAGHVTGHGLKPAACLKMLGNGVVPQQAELALRMLLSQQVAP